MAQGDLLTSGSEDLQNIDNKYYRELLSRSLFEKVGNNFNSNQIILRNLIHCLARKITKVGFDGTRQGVHHLSFYFRKEMIKLPDSKHLRTLILHNIVIDAPDLDFVASKY